MKRPGARQSPYPLRPRRNQGALAVTAAFSVVLMALLWILRPGPIELVLWSSQEKAELLKYFALKYQPDPVDRRAVRITVEEVRSGDAEARLALAWDERTPGKPHIWSPASKTWVLLLQQHREERGLEEIVPPVYQSVIQSPTVLAMLQPMAEVLKRPGAPPVSWRYVLDLAQKPSAWTTLGAPWGRFQYTMSNPRISTSGLHALIATHHAAKRTPGGPITVEDLRSEELRSYVRAFEASIARYTPSVGTLLEELYDVDTGGNPLAHLSAMAMEEKQVFDYNRGNPDQRVCTICGIQPNLKLVAFYPPEGTLIANHPYVVLSWADAAHQEAARNFLKYLETPEVQRGFVEQGFRNHTGEAGENLKEPYFNRSRPAELSVPDRPLLVQIQDSWPRTR